MATVSGEHPLSTVTSDYETLKNGCGLLDRSDERGRLALTGAGAAEFLNGQVTNEIVELSGGEGCYAAFLTHKGKMLGDLRVLAVGGVAPGGVSASDGPAPSELLLETERVALQDLFDMIRRFKIGFDVELHKRTLETSLLSLIGPSAREVAGAASNLGTGDAGAAGHIGGVPTSEHSHVATSIAGRKVRLIATSQPEGVDVLCASDDRDAVSQALLEAGATPVEQATVEMLRIELGVPRYGVDLDESVIPQEAGLNERVVSFTKGCYVGQETVARLYYKGKPNRQLRGLRLSQPLQAGVELRLGERVVGTLTSSASSPSLGLIGLSLLRREAEPGATLSAGLDGASATVVELPFSP